MLHYEDYDEKDTVAARNYTLKLSDDDVMRIAYKAGGYGLDVSELIENFIADLVEGTFTNGSDERMLADHWAERCWFSYGGAKNLVKFICKDSEGEYDTLEDLLNTIDEYDRTKEYIEMAKKDIEHPEQTDWNELYISGFNQETGGYGDRKKYKSIDEYVADLKEELECYECDLAVYQESIDDVKEGFRRYLKEDGIEMDWEKEVERAREWYKRNVDDKYKGSIYLNEETETSDNGQNDANEVTETSNNEQNADIEEARYRKRCAR